MSVWNLSESIQNTNENENENLDAFDRPVNQPNRYYNDMGQSFEQNETAMIVSGTRRTPIIRSGGMVRNLLLVI